MCLFSFGGEFSKYFPKKVSSGFSSQKVKTVIDNL